MSISQVVRLVISWLVILGSVLLCVLVITVVGTPDGVTQEWRLRVSLLV